MNDDINTKRTELANQMAAAGAALLDFTGTAAALAAIPDTEPQQYVAAGTPENIAAILPATICPQRRMRHGERPTEELQWEDTPAAISGDAPADLQQLKALALAATPGPWEYKPMGETTDPEIAAANGSRVCSLVAADMTKQNSRYIAAANPAVVLDLIARIERAAAPATASGDELPKMLELRARLVEMKEAAYTFGEYSQEAVCAALDGVLDAIDELAAVSAATKPTADLGAMKKPEDAPFAQPGLAHAWACGFNACLATKPAGVQPKPIGTVIDHDRYAGESTIDVYLDLGDDVYAAPTAAPADQVRNEALEEAAELVSDCDKRATLKGIACAIRALKRPTPTHSSEAGDA